MNTDARVLNWKRQLEAAAETLNKSSETPDWLRQVLCDSLTVAADLAPAKRTGPTQDVFYYPH